MTIAALTVLESLPPRFSATEACEVARQHYGLEAEASQLVSERDQNFRLNATDGSSWVLKIANAAEDRQFTLMQIDALKHVAAHSAPLPVPSIRATNCGADFLQLHKNGQTHVARLVSWLPGTALGQTMLKPALCRNLGVFLARLGHCLSSFQPAGGQQALLWDMREAPALREVLPLVSDSTLRELLDECLDDFAARALPEFAALRSQVIHNDFNPDNILLDSQRAQEVAGVIDFGDLQTAPLVVDVAIAASYLRNDEGDPLQHIAEFVAGYHVVTPLELAEIDLLYDLVSTRLATTVAILAWRQNERQASDPYTDKSALGEASAAPYLRRFRELPRAHASRRLRQVCASVEADAARHSK